MIAFGVDPGSRNVGWGVVRVDGNRSTFLDAGVIRVDAEAPLSDRLAEIFESLRMRLAEFGPSRVFVESVFHHKSARSALVLGHARGVVLLAARMSGAQVDELSPAEVKKAVTGNGRAEKPQVQEMVRIILGLSERHPTDAADALAVAIAGAQRARSPIATLLAVSAASRGTR